MVIAPDRWGPVAAPQIADAMARGWRTRNPSVQVISCPQSNGDAGLIGSIATARPDATMGVCEAIGSGGSPVLVPYVQVEDEGSRTAYLPLSSGQAPGSGGSSYVTGRAIRDLMAAGVDCIVVGLADSGALDGGAGFISGLAGAAPPGSRQHPEAPVVALAKQVVHDHGVDLVGAYDTAIPLLGLTGAAAAAQDGLGLDPYQAQDAEAWMSRWAHDLQQLLPGRTDLLTGKAHRHDRTPGAGAGGGVGFALAALGADLRPAAEVVAEATGLSDAIRAGDLVVTGTLVFDWHELSDSVVLQVGSSAQALARPAVILAGRVDVGRRELMSLGFSGGYGVVQSPRTPLPGQAAEITSAVEQLAYRVAGTWTPVDSSPHG
ncbi:hypothetical protein AZH51_04555 [Branchiibius sp. NY16-3462-2]|nr:hypothetical protein AZH51_04555 [Branchiibius sp. NY16-3462-2]